MNIFFYIHLIKEDAIEENLYVYVYITTFFHLSFFFLRLNYFTFHRVVFSYLTRFYYNFVMK